MADGEGSQRANDAGSPSLTTPDQAELIKTAQHAVAEVMNKAMDNMANTSKEDESDSVFLKQDLPVEKQVFEEAVEYIEPMQDPYGKAIKYLENHNILQLFQQLTASIVYTKPEHPLEHMMHEVERMKAERDQEQKKS